MRNVEKRTHSVGIQERNYFLFYSLQAKNTDKNNQNNNVLRYQEFITIRTLTNSEQMRSLYC